MTTDALFAVFANFNDEIDEPPAAPVEEAPVAFDETGKIRQEAWTEGYLAGRQEPSQQVRRRKADREAADVVGRPDRQNRPGG